MRKRTSPYYTMLGCFRLTMTNLRIIGQWFRPLSLTSKSPRTTLIFNPHYSVVLLRPGSLRQLGSELWKPSTALRGKQENLAWSMA